MATSAATHPLLMAAAEPTRLEMTANTANNIASGTDQDRQEPSRPRGRKMGRPHPPKKQPQRGMGVAQLERLRLQDQERWTKLSEIPPQPYPPPYFLPHNNPQRPGFSFPGPLDAVGGVPVQYCTPPVSTGLGLGLGLGLGHGMGMGRGHLVQRKDDGGGDHGRLVSVSVPGRVTFHAFGARAPASQGGSSKAVETSRELSSIPNAQQCVSDRCDVCLKKKRMDPQTAGFFINSGRENYPEKMRVGDCDFHGLNLEIPQSKAARPPIYPTRIDDDDKNVEVTAVRRRVNVSGSGVSMEYEFFPGKGGRSAWTEGLNFPAGEEVPADADASGYGGEASKSIDLSLKLSR